MELEWFARALFKNNVSLCLNIIYSVACRAATSSRLTFLIFNQSLMKAAGGISVF